jgi:hypothetical protein
VTLFRRARKPQPPGVTQLDVSDALAASAHGFTEQGWLALTDTDRAHYRATITNGKHFTNGMQ